MKQFNRKDLKYVIQTEDGDNVDIVDSIKEAVLNIVEWELDENSPNIVILDKSTKMSGKLFHYYQVISLITYYIKPIINIGNSELLELTAEEESKYL